MLLTSLEFTWLSVWISTSKCCLHEQITVVLIAIPIGYQFSIFFSNFGTRARNRCQYDARRDIAINFCHHILFHSVSDILVILKYHTFGLSSIPSKWHIGCCGGAHLCEKSVGTHRFSNRMGHNELWPIYFHGESTALVDHWYRVYLICKPLNYYLCHFAISCIGNMSAELFFWINGISANYAHNDFAFSFVVSFWWFIYFPR